MLLLSWPTSTTGLNLFVCLDQSPDRDELLSKMLRCDVVVYNITQQAEQVEEASWAVSGESRVDGASWAEQ